MTKSEGTRPGIDCFFGLPQDGYWESNTKPEWFARFPMALLRTKLDKYPFPSFEEIPDDTENMIYPNFTDVHFYVNPALQNNYKILYVDGFKILSEMYQPFTIHPERWYKIKCYLSNGEIEYPELSSNCCVLDGRHRILMLMKIYQITMIPMVIDSEVYDQFLQIALHKDILR
ncbi:hypothetical protein ACWA5Z_10110 [Testudinibacter sp. P80/BLE/0925]|uniref:hypothetical protein n=1 Tax=Testudinibacter sp. TW-1 TaxID=3417757 RepID=UPI003D35F195